MVNEGLNWADSVGVGMVYWTTGTINQKIPRQILSNLDAQPVTTYINFYLAHSISTIGQEEVVSVSGFASRRISLQEAITLPYNLERAWLHSWKAAAYEFKMIGFPIFGKQHYISMRGTACQFGISLILR